jgi:hypothetical protein
MYRLYYNSDGSPKYYTMEDLEGEYIEVDEQTYHVGRYDVKIVNKKLKSLNENIVSKYTIVKQRTLSTVSCDPTDILLVVDISQDNILWDYLDSN